MDSQLRKQQRLLLTNNDVESRARYLHNCIRAQPKIRKNIDFAAYMGDKAAKQVTQDTQVLKFPFALSEERPWIVNSGVWHLWKKFGRVMGKAPAIAAFIPYIKLTPKIDNESAEKELIAHCKAKLLNKKYRPTYTDKMLLFCSSSSYWDYSEDLGYFAGSWPSLDRSGMKAVQEIMMTLGGGERFISDSAALMRSLGDVEGAEQSIRESCVEWALK